MKIGLIVIGKTDAGYFVEAINEYKNRLTHYIPFGSHTGYKEREEPLRGAAKGERGRIDFKGFAARRLFGVAGREREGVHLHAIFYLSGKENAYGPETLGICGGRSLRF